MNDQGSNAVSTLAEFGPMAIGQWSWDMAAGTVTWSPDLLAIYGQSPQDDRKPTLERFTECVVPEDRTRVMAAVSRTLSSRRSGHTIYFRIRRPDGTIRHIMSRARLEIDEDGRPLTLAGIDVDLSDENCPVDGLTRPVDAASGRLDLLAGTTPEAPDPFSLAMRERDDLLRLLDAMPVMVTLYDPDHEFVLLNSAFEKITGWPRSVTSVETIMEAVYPDPDYRARVVAFMAQCAGWMEITLRRRDGRDIETCWTNVRLSGQRQLGIGFDLTAQNDLRSTLRLTKKTLRLAQDVAKVGYFNWDIETNVNIWSPEIEQLYGLPEGGFGGTYEAWAERVHPEDLPKAEAAVRDGLRSGAFACEWRAVRPHGEVFWIEARALVEKAPDGTPKRMVGVNLDITERKQMEKALRREARAAREHAAELAAVGEAAPIGIVLFDTDFRFLWCNRWLADLNRISAAEVVGRPIEELTGPATSSALRAMQPRLLAGETVEDEIQVDDPAAGVTRFFALAYKPLTDEAGKPTRFLGVVREVTERRFAEQYRETAMRELSHRVKNIFTVVQSIASRTFRGDDSPALKDFQGRLRALAAAHDLLLQSAHEDASLGEILRKTLAAFQDDDRLTMAGPAISVAGRSASLLALAIHELATNAMKYGALSTERGRVDIRWRVEQMEASRDFVLTWAERDGPTVSTPDIRGFGSIMLEGLLATSLGGAVSLAFNPGGVVCEIRWKDDGSA